MFYIFGAFLLYTAINFAREGLDEEAEDFKENVLIRWSRRALPLSPSFDAPASPPSTPAAASSPPCSSS